MRNFDARSIVFYLLTRRCDATFGSKTTAFCVLGGVDSTFGDEFYV